MFFYEVHLLVEALATLEDVLLVKHVDLLPGTLTIRQSSSSVLLYIKQL